MPRVAPRSLTVATLQPSALAPADVTNTATTIPSEWSGVRSSTRISAMVARPTANDFPSSRPGCSKVSRARVSRED